MSDETTEQKLEFAPIEGRFIQGCKSWGEKLEAWSVRTAQLKAEREALDREFENTCVLSAGEFVGAGMNAVDAEKHMEKLMEKAFAK